MIDASRAMKARRESAGERAREQGARRQDAGDDLRQALDPHAGVVRRRHAPARRRGHPADRAGDAARARRDHRRHRARALALCRHHHDPHARPRDGDRARALRHRACDQRADPALASLPGAGRRPHLRGASRADPGQDRRLDRRCQQRARLLDARGRALRVPARGGDPARARAEEMAHRLDQALGRPDRGRHRPGRGRRRLPTASSPTRGCRWGTRTGSAATTCCQALPGQCRG